MHFNTEHNIQHAQKLLSEGKSIQKIIVLLRSEIHSEEEIIHIQKQLEYDLQLKKQNKEN